MNIILRLAAVSILCMMLAVSSRTGVAQTVEAASDPVALAIAAELDALANPDVNTIRGAGIALQERVQEFYSRRAFRPAWTDPQIAGQLLRALADSYADGLDPADYHLPLLRELAAQRCRVDRNGRAARSVRCAIDRRPVAPGLSPVVWQSGSRIIRSAMELRPDAGEHRCCPGDRARHCRRRCLPASRSAEAYASAVCQSQA